MSNRRPAYQQRHPPLDGFRVAGIYPTNLTAAFCRLYRALYGFLFALLFRISEYQRERFRALPPHSTPQVISSDTNGMSGCSFQAATSRSAINIRHGYSFWIKKQFVINGSLFILPSGDFSHLHRLVNSNPA